MAVYAVENPFAGDPLSVKLVTDVSADSQWEPIVIPPSEENNPDPIADILRKLRQNLDSDSRNRLQARLRKHIEESIPIEWINVWVSKGIWIAESIAAKVTDNVVGSLRRKDYLVVVPHPDVLTKKRITLHVCPYDCERDRKYREKLLGDFDQSELIIIDTLNQGSRGFLEGVTGYIIEEIRVYQKGFWKLESLPSSPYPAGAVRQIEKYIDQQIFVSRGIRDVDDFVIYTLRQQGYVYRYIANYYNSTYAEPLSKSEIQRKEKALEERLES
jgi:hypothetical protein